MKLTLAPTDTIDRVGSIPCARWEGVTESGADVVVWARAMEIGGERNCWRLTFARDPDYHALPGMFRALLFDDGLSDEAVALDSSPLGGTIWGDETARKRLLNAIASAATNTVENRKRLSSIVVGHNRATAVSKADRTLYEAMRLVVIAERAQCRTIAAEHSPEAAAAITDRPLPPPWEAI